MDFFKNNITKQILNEKFIAVFMWIIRIIRLTTKYLYFEMKPFRTQKKILVYEKNIFC